MKLSVIIPVYNVEKYLRECLESVVNQTLQDIEIICVNDGSTDSSALILDEYARNDNRIKVYTQENQGQGAARNMALELAQGDYIAFVDSDDWLEVSALEELYKFITEKGAEAVVFDFVECSEQTGKKKFENFARKTKKHYHYDLLKKGCFSWRDLKGHCLLNLTDAAWHKIYSREFLIKNGIRFGIGRNNEDDIFSQKVLFCADKIYYLGRYLYNYRARMNSSVERFGLERIEIFKALRQTYEFLNNRGLLDELSNEFFEYKIREIANAYKYIPQVQQDIYMQEAEKYLTDTEYLNLKQKIKNNNSLLENIFSVKNVRQDNRIHKVITLCGKQYYCNLSKIYNNIKDKTEKIVNISTYGEHIIFQFLVFKFKIKPGFLPQKYKEFISYNTKPKTILIIEFNHCHMETIPGYSRYLVQLGYNVCVLTRFYTGGVFSLIKDKSIKVFECNPVTFDKIYEDADFSKFERIIYNSRGIYFRKNDVNNTNYNDIFEYFSKIKQGKKKNIYVQHHIEKMNRNSQDKYIILANPKKEAFLEPLVVNPHYFGKITQMPRNKIVSFISIGELSSERRNVKLLTDAVENLVKLGYTYFKINIIGGGNLENLAPSIKKYFNILGRLNYKDMFNYLEKSDYILPLLDPDLKAHNRYLSSGTSGTFQLVYGFLKPCLIHRKFADVYNFNSQNSIIYEKNEEFFQAMINAIDLRQEQYGQLQSNLLECVRNIEDKSLQNLKYMLGEN